MNINGRTVLVTGASQGLGLALARGLARRGARVVMVARGAEALEAAAATIRAEGGEVHAIAADVGDKHSVHRIAAAAAAAVGPVDVLIHNASTLGPTPLRLLLDTECEDLTAVLETNVVGPFRLTKVVAGSMAVRGTGLVLSVTSDASVAGYPTWGAYGVSKAALDHLGRIWGAELEASGVRFVTVDPGEMDTRMHADAVPDADRTQLADPAAVAERVIAMVLHADQIATGSRVEVARWSPAAVAS